MTNKKVEIDRAYDIKNSFLFRVPIAKSFCIMFSVHFVIFFYWILTVVNFTF